MMKQPEFAYGGTNSWEIKCWFEKYWDGISQKWVLPLWSQMGLVKNGFCHSGHRPLKLAISLEGISGINRFFAC